jgi:hypothetical protein
MIVSTERQMHWCGLELIALLQTGLPAFFFVSLLTLTQTAAASVVIPGTDFLTTPAWNEATLSGGACVNFNTANQVCNGSAGDIPLQSVAIPNLIPDSGTGLTHVDTVTQRQGTIQGTNTIPFELTGLYLKSVSPVAVPGMPGTLGDLYVTVNKGGLYPIPVYDTLAPSTGTLTVDSNPGSGSLVFHTSFTVTADAIFARVGTDPNNPSNVIFHGVNQVTQTSNSIQAAGTPNALPGTPVNPLVVPTSIVLSEIPPTGPDLGGEPPDPTLTFNLPFQVVPGDVVLGENGTLPNLTTTDTSGHLMTSNWSDIVRFGTDPNNPNGSIATFYSDPLPPVCATAFVFVSMPTYAGSPHSTVTQVPCPGLVLSSNAQGIPEIGPELSNAGFYSPGGNVNYTFVSDVPEPVTWLLLPVGWAVFLGFRWCFNMSGPGASMRSGSPILKTTPSTKRWCP